MSNFKELFYDLIFPKKCIGCGAEGNWLCRDCFEKIVIVRQPFCPNCQKLTKSGQYCSRCRVRQSLTGVIIAAHYENPLKEAIHKFKYEKLTELSDPFLEILITRLEAGFPVGKLVLVPVPLTKKRESERGYNQAEILANLLAEAFEIPTINNLLVRIKEKPSQVSLRGEERRKNVLGIFAVRGETAKIKNKTILLVDDVMTTGATLN